MYVSNNFKINTADEMDEFIKKFDQANPTWSDLLTIDYFYHHHMSDYDGGLSFIDRINTKIGHFHPEWNIADLKNCIKISNDPVSVYSNIIQFMFLELSDILYYGI
jgi:hypothetical protein